MDEDAERIMRERRPTPANKDEMLELMAKTRDARRHWINEEKPDCTKKLKWFPRLCDMMESVGSFLIKLSEINCIVIH